MTRTLSTVALVLLVPFTVFSVWVVYRDGYTGFLGLAREPWGLQVLIDLVLACTLYAVWLVPDARQRGLRAWPYVVVTLFAGSIGGLAYLVRRGYAAAPANRPVAGDSEGCRLSASNPV